MPRRALLYLTCIIAIVSVSGRSWQVVFAQPPATVGDFNGDEIVNIADLSALLLGMGKSSYLFDLTGDGRVDFLDVFLFIGRFGRSLDLLPTEPLSPISPLDPDLPPQAVTNASTLPEAEGLASDPDLPPQAVTAAPTGPAHDLPGDGKNSTSPSYHYWASNTAVTFNFPEYRIVIRRGKPFGIVSLRLQGQRTNFVPQQGIGVLADWEWLRFGPDGRRQWLKLITPSWSLSEIDAGSETVRVQFSYSNAVMSGVTLEVIYELDVRLPHFAVHYIVHNRSARTLIQPYVMLGFPGFSNFASVVEVETAFESRVPEFPFENFRDEAQAAGLDEYILLSHYPAPETPSYTALQGNVVVAEGARRFALKAQYNPSHSYHQLFSAHTNKPDYLTSHLYLSRHTLPSGREHIVTVHYWLYERESAD